jgi:signal transduction histidine kinase
VTDTPDSEPESASASETASPTSNSEQRQPGTANSSSNQRQRAATADSDDSPHPQERTPGAPARPPRPRFSLAGRLTAVVVLILLIEAVVVAGLMRVTGDPWLGLLLGLLIGLPLGAWLVGRVLRPLDRTIEGLHFGIASFHDHDYSVRLASDRNDELGALAKLYNEVGEALREERLSVRSKELLLQSALDNSPVAIILVNPVDRVIFSNLEARRLLTGGGRPEGRQFAADIAKSCPPEMQEILAQDGDGVFSVRDDDGVETYHLSRREFVLNRRRHLLVLLYRMTAELGRQEAAIWKKVIRVISHELNNSLAPVSSLVHSAELINRRPEHSDRAEEVFATIHERLDHLTRFIDGYARFARLPAPRREPTTWATLIEDLDEFPSLEIDGPLPSRTVHLDPAHLRQLLVNLVKNAFEASERNRPVTLRVGVTADGGTCLQIRDVGHGMDEETMKRALLPFYSTKKTGTGLGLALCREIVEGHGGRIGLQQRPGGGTIVSCWFPEHRTPGTSDP